MDDLLQRVERPSQYLGNEINAVRKDPEAVTFRMGLAYPDLYEIGMSNTGLHILYFMLNEDPSVAAERVYLPAEDLEALLRAENTPLTSLESRTPLHQLDILGIQIPHELSYTNIVKMLRLGQVPVWSKDREEGHPIVLGGGPGVFGAEPVAPFYDAMLLGDAEEAVWEVIRVVREGRDTGRPRAETLRALAQVTGVYVPSLYDVEYDDQPPGPSQLTAIRARDGAPEQVFKAVLEDLETAYYPEKAIVPYAETVHNRLGVEVMRGCTVGCRFCQAGMIYRPLRERSPRRILDLAKCGLGSTGFEDISLLSLDTGDYTLIDPLTKELLESTAEKRVALSLPSLRAGSLTDDVIRDITRVRRTSFTIAPEAGSQRMRDVINKNISDEEIFETVERVARNGWRGVKMYFMVGFPTETDEDLDGLVDLVVRCRNLARQYVRHFEVTASLGTLVPKPHTPFQWDAQLSVEESERRLKYVARQLRAEKIGCKYHDPQHSWMEGVFSRADRRLAPVIADAESRGAGFESWNDRLNHTLWAEVFADHGIEADAYLRQRDMKEVLPWDHLSARVTKKFLQGDRRKVDKLAQPVTFDCRDDLCAGCSTCFTDDIRNRLAKYDPDPFGDQRKLPVALTSRVAVGHGVGRQLEGSPARDQAAKAGEAAAAAQKRRRSRPTKPSQRRWAVTPGAPGVEGPAPAFLEDGPSEPAPSMVTPESIAEPRERPPVPTTPVGESQDGPVDQYHYRFTYQRRGELRWLSHREVMRTIYRLLQRSEIPLKFTEGYHPKAKLAFGPPLPVGSESLHEDLDLFLVEDLTPEQLFEGLAPLFPADQGLIPMGVVRAQGSKSAHAERLGARWSVSLTSVGVPAEDARAAVAAWEARDEVVIEVRRGNKKPRLVNLREVVDDLEVGDHPLEETHALFFTLNHEGPSAKPMEVVASVLDLPPERARLARLLLVEPLKRPGVEV